MTKDLMKAIQTFDDSIPEPNNPMVDYAHIEIAVAWQRIKDALIKQEESFIDSVDKLVEEIEEKAVFIDWDERQAVIDIIKDYYGVW